MELNEIIWILFIAIAIGYSFYSFRITKEDERFAVTINGRFQKLVGPGLLMKLPGGAGNWEKLQLGQLGHYTGDGIARFGDMALPVKYSTKPQQGVCIEKFDGNDVWVTPSNVLSVRCEKCGHHTQVGV